MFRRTNLIGLQSLQAAFTQYPVIPIEMADISERTLHLKSACSLCGINHILVGGVEGLSIQKQIEAKRPKCYRFTHVADAAASNVVFVNGTLIRRQSDEFPLSSAVLAALNKGNQVEVAAGELAKVDGALTCCSLLI